MPPKERKAEDIDDPEDLQGIIDLMDIVERSGVPVGEPTVALLPPTTVTDDPTEFDIDPEPQDEEDDWPTWDFHNLQRGLGIPGERRVLVDPRQVPRGRGRWYYFDVNVDRPRARQLGILSAPRVARAYELGLIPAGAQNPRTVFVPDPELLNPDHQPTDRGHWEFYTTEAHRMAQTQLQGQLYFAPGRVITARDVFHLRQLYAQLRANGQGTRVNMARGIDIVWVPHLADPRPSVPSSPQAEPESDNERPPDPDVVDKDTGIEHEPTNQANNGYDQTGTIGERRLQTRRINGTNFTVDRKRAYPGNRVKDGHKLWAVNTKGEWQPYPQAATLDWNSKESVEKLNKWREQAFKRWGWNKKREESRNVYAEEEKQWLWDNFVAPSRGNRPSTGTPNITSQFNEHFSVYRKSTGIAGLLKRLRDEYNANGGNRRPQPRPSSQQEPENPEPKEPEPDVESSDDE